MNNMKFDPKQWVRPHILTLSPYSSARDEFSGPALVYLDANENPYGDGLNRYPDPKQTFLRKDISSMMKIKPEQLFLGNGSDEAIDLLIRLSCKPGRDRILSIAPSYGMYEVCASVNDIRTDKVLLNDDFSLSADRVLESVNESHKILFLCSPNNPSGNILNKDGIIKVLNAFTGIVVVDEAYIDFAAGKGLTGLLAEYNNLVLLRTFSKAWGLAGVRCGMALAHPDVVSFLMKIKYPYNISSLSMESIRQGIKNRQNIDKIIRIIKVERDKIIKVLRDIEGIIKVYPSEANFVLIRVESPDYIYDQLIKRGLVVRNRSREVLCDGCLRLTIGKPDENEQLINAMKEILA